MARLQCRFHALVHPHRRWDVGLWHGAVVRESCLCHHSPLVLCRHQRLFLLARHVQGDGDGEKGNLGTIYFPLSFAALLWVFWGRPHLIAAGLMPMTRITNIRWGDALAAIIGRRIGRRRYTVLGSTRSVEGSMTMFFAGWVATSVALMLLGTGNPMTALWVAAVTAFGAAVIEAISPWGIDNLTVPAVSALTLALMLA